MKKFHNPKTLFTQGLKEKNTWIGIGLLIFGCIYYKEIDTLIRNLLSSNDLIISLANVAGTAIGAYLVFKRDGNAD